MSTHTRKPYKLDYKTYLTWMREFAKWLLARCGDPDFPSHIVPSVAAFDALIDAFQAVLGPYDNLIQLTHARNKLYSTAFENIYNKLKQIKWALPTIADDPEILALFNLAGELPDDRDDMFITAQNALTYWATVVADPLFAPMVADFTALQILFDDFVAARETYFNTDNERETKQNELLAAKEALDTIERDCFQWYRSRHPKGDDEWWTGTEWGTVSEGEGGGQPQPGELPEIPDKPTGVYANFSMDISPHIMFGCGAYGAHTGFDVRRLEVGIGVPKDPILPDENFATNIPIDTEPLMDLSIQPGKKYYYWTRARNGNEVGEWSDPVSAEYEM